MLVVNVDPEEMASVFIDMNSNNLNFGSIIVESDPPGASVYLNDVLTDFVTPDSIRNLIPGIYKIKCIKSEHRSDSANVLLSAQKTSNVFLTLRDTSEWVDYTMNSEGLPSNYFSDVVFYRNSMWFATKDKGLLQFNGNDWFHYPIAEYGLTSITINKLVPDNNGNLWLCINGYLVQFNNGYKEFITHEYIGQDFNDMVIDDNGTFWLATRSGLVKYDGSSWEIISDDSNNMDLTYANVLCFDANKKLYIGTATHINETGYTTSGTLVRYSGDHFDVVSMTSANYYFYAKTFTSMSLDDSGKLWAAYVLGLWSRDSRISFVNSSDSLEVYPWSQIVSNNVDSYQVNDIYSQAGNMLIALDGGLIDFNISASSAYYNYTNSALSYSGIKAVTKDKSGAIWVATTNSGVYKFKR